MRRGCGSSKRFSTSSPLAVLGATGYTGRLLCASARELGLPLRLIGRRREALEEIAGANEDVRVADARDVDALARAFDGAFAVVSLAGPFLEVGLAPVEASIRAGAHYLDSSGEQAFAREVYQCFGERAAERGVVLLTSFGFDYVPGDLAARLASAGLEPDGTGDWSRTLSARVTAASPFPSSGQASGPTSGGSSWSGTPAGSGSASF